jgi:hypothetical protein
MHAHTNAHASTYGHTHSKQKETYNGILQTKHSTMQQFFTLFSMATIGRAKAYSLQMLSPPADTDCVTEYAALVYHISDHTIISGIVRAGLLGCNAKL